jgi:hypothetical protein
VIPSRRTMLLQWARRLRAHCDAGIVCGKLVGTLPLKIMFTKQDKEFDEMVTDPARRRAGIVGFTLRRNTICWCAVGMTLLALVFFVSNRVPRGAAAIGFAAAVQWMLLFKFESDLRLLRVVERFREDADAKTTA